MLFLYKLLAFKYLPKILQPQKVLFKGKLIHFGSRLWFAHNYKEIFIDKNYLFESNNNAPYILDCGSNIGLSIIFFKNLFPNSEIIGFEPDKKMYLQCVKNIETFKFKNVKIFEKAVWIEDSILEFVSTKNLGGQLNVNIENPEGEIVKVESIRLLSFINRKIDFLKIDIEGVELNILQDISENLNFVENIFIEYHSSPEKDQKLDLILKILNQAGFKYYIKEAYNNRSFPYIDKYKKSTFDLQLNIFGYRK